MSDTETETPPAVSGEASGGEEGNDGDHHVFWVDEVADRIEARDPEDPIVIKGAVSPSGIPHVGHFNEIIRGYYVAEVLRERGHEVRQVFTTDDRDALRKLPRRLATEDWEIVELGDVDAGALGRNLGVPYTDIPDPFGDCHDSYGDHFSALLAESAEMVGVPLETLSTTDLYESGAFDDAVRETLEKADLARDVLGAYQDGVDDAYVPFMPNCAECGKQLTTEVAEVDLDAGIVHYECVGGEASNREVEGCGHAGEATFREGKLPWRFEWPAGWKALGVDFEPFGKDHAEGSWPSGEEIAREVYGIDPPVPMVYEWFTLNGEALSSSAGNVVTVSEILDLIEPEVLRYFFAKDPNKQRDLDLARIDQLVDEFDRFEAAYFGEVDAGERDRRFAERAYPFVAEEVSEDRVRIPYTFAAVLGMTDDRDLRLEMARREGHLAPGAPEPAIEAALNRVERARTWAERMDNEYNYRLQEELPDAEFDPEVRAALEDLADFVAGVDDADVEDSAGEAIQGEIYETAKRHGIDVGDFFAAGYRLFFGTEQGPRLGPFLAALDRTFVLDRLRRNG
ncbi:MAG: lysine--tRNA ligase [Halobacteriales archaeon]